MACYVRLEKVAFYVRFGKGGLLFKVGKAAFVRLGIGALLCKA